MSDKQLKNTAREREERAQRRDLIREHLQVQKEEKSLKKAIAKQRKQKGVDVNPSPKQTSNVLDSQKKETSRTDSQLVGDQKYLDQPGLRSGLSTSLNRQTPITKKKTAHKRRSAADASEIQRETNEILKKFTQNFDDMRPTLMDAESKTSDGVRQMWKNGGFESPKRDQHKLITSTTANRELVGDDPLPAPGTGYDSDASFEEWLQEQRKANDPDTYSLDGNVDTGSDRKDFVDDLSPKQSVGTPSEPLIGAVGGLSSLHTDVKKVEHYHALSHYTEDVNDVDPLRLVSHQKAATLKIRNNNMPQRTSSPPRERQTVLDANMHLEEKQPFSHGRDHSFSTYRNTAYDQLEMQRETERMTKASRERVENLELTQKAGELTHKDYGREQPLGQMRHVPSDESSSTTSRGTSDIVLHELQKKRKDIERIQLISSTMKDIDNMNSNINIELEELGRLSTQYVQNTVNARQSMVRQVYTILKDNNDEMNSFVDAFTKEMCKTAKQAQKRFSSIKKSVETSRVPETEMESDDYTPSISTESEIDNAGAGDARSGENREQTAASSGRSVSTTTQTDSHHAPSNVVSDEVEELRGATGTTPPPEPKTQSVSDVEPGHTFSEKDDPPSYGEHVKHRIGATSTPCDEKYALAGGPIDTETVALRQQELIETVDELNSDFNNHIDQSQEFHAEYDMRLRNFASQVASLAPRPGVNQEVGHFTGFHEESPIEKPQKLETGHSSQTNLKAPAGSASQFVGSAGHTHQFQSPNLPGTNLQVYTAGAPSQPNVSVGNVSSASTPVVAGQSQTVTAAGSVPITSTPLQQPPQVNLPIGINITPNVTYDLVNDPLHNQTILVPKADQGQFKRQGGSLSFTDGTMLQYENFKEAFWTLKSRFRWSDDRAATELYLSLKGRAMEKVNELSRVDRGDHRLILKKLDHTFLPPNYLRELWNKFKLRKFKRGETMRNCVDDMGTLHVRARPHATQKDREDDIRSQLLSTLPEDIIRDIAPHIHKDVHEIADYYDQLCSEMRINNVTANPRVSFGRSKYALDDLKANDMLFLLEKIQNETGTKLSLNQLKAVFETDDGDQTSSATQTVSTDSGLQQSNMDDDSSSEAKIAEIFNLYLKKTQGQYGHKQAFRPYSQQVQFPPGMQFPQMYMPPMGQYPQQGYQAMMPQMVMPQVGAQQQQQGKQPAQAQQTASQNNSVTSNNQNRNQTQGGNSSQQNANNNNGNGNNSNRNNRRGRRNFEPCEYEHCRNPNSHPTHRCIWKKADEQCDKKLDKLGNNWQTHLERIMTDRDAKIDGLVKDMKQLKEKGSHLGSGDGSNKKKVTFEKDQ